MRRQAAWRAWALLILLAPVLALAFGMEARAATPQTLVQSIEIRADAESVWDAYGGFDTVALWHPLVASSPATQGNEVGSVRTLTLKAPGSPKIIEELTFYNPRMQVYEYRIKSADPAALPVTDCTVKFHIGKGKGDLTTKIVWTAHFTAADGITAGHASDMMNQLFRAGLVNIKHIAED